MGVVCLFAAQAFAQSAAERQVRLAEERLEQVRRIVEAGAAPRRDLDRARTDLADARDALLLEQTLYGPDLSEESADAMLAVAERRVARRRAEMDAVREMVESGGLPRARLDEPRQRLAWAEEERSRAFDRAALVRALADTARAELAAETAEPVVEVAVNGPAAERFDGAAYDSEHAKAAERAFIREFGKALPVSARGQTEFHLRLGFDHRDRVDVALHPDEPEGIWLRRFLVKEGIPYFAFRGSVPGKSSGAHIHIGPASPRVSSTD